MVNNDALLRATFNDETKDFNDNDYYYYYYNSQTTQLTTVQGVSVCYGLPASRQVRPQQTLHIIIIIIEESQLILIIIIIIVIIIVISIIIIIIDKQTEFSTYKAHWSNGCNGGRQSNIQHTLPLPCYGSRL